MRYLRLAGRNNRSTGTRHHPAGNESLGKNLQAAGEIRKDPVLALRQALQPTPCYLRRRLRLPLVPRAAAGYLVELRFRRSGTRALTRTP